jgi:hypothetical protein
MSQVCKFYNRTYTNALRYLAVVRLAVIIRAGLWSAGNAEVQRLALRAETCAAQGEQYESSEVLFRLWEP